MAHSTHKMQWNKHWSALKQGQIFSRLRLFLSIQILIFRALHNVNIITCLRWPIVRVWVTCGNVAAHLKPQCVVHNRLLSWFSQIFLHCHDFLESRLPSGTARNWPSSKNGIYVEMFVVCHFLILGVIFIYYRAVYFKADIYLLDDPLSAVDVRVGRKLFDE